jgi:hypothetical protein
MLGDTPLAAPPVPHAMQWYPEAGPPDHAIAAVFPLGELRVPLAPAVPAIPVAYAQRAIFRVLARAVALYAAAARTRLVPERATRALSAVQVDTTAIKEVQAQTIAFVPKRDIM